VGITKRRYDSQFKNGVGMAGEDPSLGGRRLSHAGLYVLMFIVSLTGWMVATTFRVPITKDLLGIDLPPLVTTVDRSVRQWIEESHMVVAYVLAAVVLIHVVAALRHHVVKRNDVLRRMIWSGRAEAN